MPPLTQCELIETLTAFFNWADFSCSNMPKVQSYFCHETVPGLTFTEPSMAKQSFKKEADINHIVKQFNKTGVLPSGDRQPLYGDFSSGDDYNQSLIKIQEAQEDFDNLPSNIRERFKNDPANLLTFVQDEENYEEAVALGILQASTDAVGGEGGAAPHTPEEPSSTPSTPTNLVPPEPPS